MGYTNSHGFSKGGGKCFLCSKPQYSAGHSSRTAICKCIYRKRHMTDVLHGADVAAVNVGHCAAALRNHSEWRAPLHCQLLKKNDA